MGDLWEREEKSGIKRKKTNEVEKQTEGSARRPECNIRPLPKP